MMDGKGNGKRNGDFEVVSLPRSPHWLLEPEVEVPPEVNTWLAEVIVEMVAGLRALHAPDFLLQGGLIDTSTPPYEVPCPTCMAFALEACRHERREGERETFFGPVPGPWPSTSRMLKSAHRTRWALWNDHPEYRVQRG